MFLPSVAAPKAGLAMFLCHFLVTLHFSPLPPKEQAKAITSSTTMISNSQSPSPTPSSEMMPQTDRGSSGSKEYGTHHIPSTGDETYREILESCRHFYAFESSPAMPLVHTEILPRLEDSILMLQRKQQASVS